MKQSRRLSLPQLPYRIASDGWWLVLPAEPRATVFVNQSVSGRLADSFRCAA